MTMAAGTFAFAGGASGGWMNTIWWSTSWQTFGYIRAGHVGGTVCLAGAVLPGSGKTQSDGMAGDRNAAVRAFHLGMLRIFFRVQAGSGQAALQAGQMMRRPLLGLAVAGILLTHTAVCGARCAFDGQPGDGLKWQAVSMNYYLLHQNLAVHLKRLRSTRPRVNRTGREQPWQLRRPCCV